MPTDVVMPQMGESIFEGTLTKWLKKPGDKVQRDEPLFEISTDKVDAEIPSPASGVLKEIKVNEGSTVQVNSVVGVIDAEGAGAATPAPAPAKPEPAKAAGKTTGGAASTEGPPPPPSPQAEGTSRAQQPQPTEAAAQPRKGDGARRQEPEPVYQQPAARTQQPSAAAQRESVIEFPGAETDEEGKHIRSSPLVRRIARENNIDLNGVPGTGLGGRITKDDVMNFISQQGAGGPKAAPSRAATAPAYQPAMPSREAPAVAPAAAAPAVIPGEIVPMTTMRKKIAEHMVQSKRTSAHVHSVFEVDFTRIVRLR
ncbi:MAG: E3 binding domain-containing protein, partial [Acidobacteriaceae bacterium]|nr:E3 binding domain-containing protein [Acidobacteriaceae bacterium]